MIQPEKNDRHCDCHETRRNIPRPYHGHDSFSQRPTRSKVKEPVTELRSSSTRTVAPRFSLTRGNAKLPSYELSTCRSPIDHSVFLRRIFLHALGKNREKKRSARKTKRNSHPTTIEIKLQLITFNIKKKYLKTIILYSSHHETEI